MESTRLLLACIDSQILSVKIDVTQTGTNNLNFILLLPHSSVNTLLPREQLLVTSLFRDHSVLENDDHIRVGDSFQSVGMQTVSRA